MRVSAPRPRHTSHGEDKNTEGNKETSGDNANEKTKEDAENEQDTGLVNRILKIFL
jgi:hypothetical protein